MGAYDSCRGHLGACNLLDLASRAGSIVNQDALTELQIHDVLLASDLLGQCEGMRGGGQRQSGKQGVAKAKALHRCDGVNARHCGQCRQGTVILKGAGPQRTE